jgi:TRAP transporter 4TM/12TM fusion protein
MAPMLGTILNPAMQIMRAAIVLIVAVWILNLPGRMGVGLFTEQVLVAVLGLALALTFLTFPFGAKLVGEEAVVAKVLQGEKEKPGVLDIVLAILSLLTCFYVAARYPQLIVELVSRPPSGVIIASIIVLLVFEASRRVAGLSLVLIVLALCAHALLGWMLPEQFASRPVSIPRLMVYLGIDTNALLGNTLQIAVIVVVPFIIMGHVLNRCGGADFFADLAAALMGRYRGGAGKIAVASSAFFGMVSGSAVANVASVGTVTIPLMKRAGFPPHTAAGIEAVASTGGQIDPPVMGAAAFIMAEYLQVPYAEVMVAAIIPALLYHSALFMQVDLESAKLGILGTPRARLPKMWQVLREGWHFLIPFAVLIYGLLGWNMEPEYAALFATAVLMVLAVIIPYRGRRVPVRDVVGAALSSGGAVIDIIVITAIAGVLIGALNLTGVAFSLTQQLLTISGGSLALLLIVTAFAAFLLGLPLPTVGVYVILATLAAPALVQAGVSPMAAHMFVLFNGILGMVTPPVALAAFAAATIAQADQWKSSWTAMRLSWCSYFIPFLFVYSPELLMNGDPISILSRVAFAMFGIFIGTVAVVGYLQVKVPIPYRVAYAAIALMLLAQPRMFEGAIWLNIIGLVLVGCAILREILRGRSRPKLAAP